MSYCNFPEEHEREGRQDFERRGRYGYDYEKYNDHFNDCNESYTKGFDSARREEDRRQEDREMEERQEREEMNRQRQQQEMNEQRENEFFFQQQYYDERQAKQYRFEQPDDLPF